MRRRIKEVDRDILHHDVPLLANAPEVAFNNSSPTPPRALSRSFILLVSVLVLSALIFFGLLAVVESKGDGGGGGDRSRQMAMAMQIELRQRLRGGGDAARVPIFSNEFEGAPQCTPIDADDVTYTLVTQCSTDRLWMIGHQCKRWGTNHPISLVVYTEQTLEEVTRELVEGGCTLNQISQEGGGGKGNVLIVDPSASWPENCWWMWSITRSSHYLR
jgi:hypothetical protein